MENIKANTIIIGEYIKISIYPLRFSENTFYNIWKIKEKYF